MAICSPAVPGAAEAVKQSGRKDVKVIGLGLPNDNKRYVHEGITDAVILWNTMDLGYLTVHAADGRQGRARSSRATTPIEAGRLGQDRDRRATTSCSASRSRSPRRTSTSSTSDPDADDVAQEVLAGLMATMREFPTARPKSTTRASSAEFLIRSPLRAGLGGAK